MTAKILTLDLESSPHLAHVWQLWDANVGLTQLREATKVISFAAKWYGKKPVEFYSDYHNGHEAMVQRAHDLVDQADVIITYNGVKFDLPHLRREFIEAGLTPPSPHRDIDLLKVAKSRFRFASNKLQYVSTALGLKGKVQHEGHQLWVDCLEGDEETRRKAWNKMRRYNIGDVRLTEDLYDLLRPWVTNHPHLGLYTDLEDDVCGKCSGANLERRGLAYTPLGAYQQYRCRTCGAWSRGRKAVLAVDARPVAGA